MRKTVYIHIGNFKTGTTAIQKFCHDYSERLKENNFRYISNNRPSNNITNHGKLSLSLYEKFGGVPPRDWYNDDTTFEEEIKVCIDEIESSSQENIIISSEEFWRLPTLPNGKEAIQHLYDSFSAYKLKIIIYIREPFSFSKSWYNQVIKGGVAVKPYLDFFLSTPLSFLLPGEQLKSWEQFVGSENIILKEYAKSGVDHINEFLNLLGMKDLCENNDLTKTINQAIPHKKLEARRLENILKSSNNQEHIQYLYQSNVLDDITGWTQCQQHAHQLNQEFNAFMQEYLPDVDYKQSDFFDHFSYHNDINTLNLKEFTSRNLPIEAYKKIINHKNIYSSSKNK